MNFKRTFLVTALSASLVIPQLTPSVQAASTNVISGLTSYAGQGSLQPELIARYTSGAGLDEGGTEIVAYDKLGKKLFSVNGAEKALDIISLSTLTKDSDFKNLSLTKRVALEDIASEKLNLNDLTSVAISPNSNYIAISAPAEPKTDNGYILFLDTNGEYISHVQVGALPDMVTFTPDGKYVLVANEGEPNDDYTIDPAGGVSIIDLQNGPQSLSSDSVTTVGFDTVNANGIRIGKPGVSFALDAEPEFITVAEDSSKAYITLQENNAIATLDIASKTITSVKSLGHVDYSMSGQALDASDKDDATQLKNWPVLGTFMPDAISLYNANGKTYLLTANEGDSRDYAGYSEEVRIADLAGKLALKADNYAGYTQVELDALLPTLTEDDALGRLKTSTSLGVNGAGQYEALYAYGTRSFSVWDADTIELVYDSADSFERITKLAVPDSFNTDSTENKADSRSDDKGVEPESIITGKVGDKTYAFVGLERMSGIMAYDLANPEEPLFDMFLSSRNFSASGEADAGDLAPEGMSFVAAENSPTGQALLIVAHEVSGTIAVYELTPSEQTRIQVIHTNDIHSRVYEDGGMGYAKVAAVVDAYRKLNPNTIVLDGGDTLHGQTYSTLVEGSSIIDIMNEIGYTAMTSGNHDYNYGFDRLVELADSAKYPILAANVKNADGSYVLEPYVIKEINNLKVGIFGLATPETLYKTHPNNVEGLSFISPVQASKEMVAELEGNVDIIIAVAHLGTDGSTLVENRSDYILTQVDGIDLFVDGHSHQVVSRVINDTLLVQDGEYAEQVGIVTLVLEDGKIVDKTSQFITAQDAATMAANPEVEKLIEDTSNSQKALLDQVIGQSSVKLEGEREVVRTGESNLGNLIADAMLEVTGADVSLTNGGGIRASIDAGEITKGEVITVLPFGNYIVTIEVTGAELLAALEVGAAGYPSAHGAFAHVGGVSYKIDDTKEASQRVHSVKVNDAALKLDQTYLLATNDFIAAGGDQYSMFVDNKIINNAAALDEALISYIQKLGKINTATEGRIIVEKKSVAGQANSSEQNNTGTKEPATPQDNQATNATVDTYIVQKNDNLTKIAKRYNTTWQELQKLNKLKNANRIYPGQKLIVPVK
ncbi:MAG TPA: choice-of-anchor I family protein [Candidatus Paenibacillus intestinavium]|nr:choice-of-anchor I family protein [Candidatus Paenibacillus intestinavium]